MSSIMRGMPSRGFDRVGRRRRRRLGLNGRRGAVGSGHAGRLSGDRRAGDQAGREQRGGHQAGMTKSSKRS